MRSGTTDAVVVKFGAYNLLHSVFSYGNVQTDKSTTKAIVSALHTFCNDSNFNFRSKEYHFLTECFYERLSQLEGECIAKHILLNIRNS